MKKLLTLFLLTIVAGAAFAQDAPMPSPAGSVSTRVGNTDVVVNYFRPQLKGRKVFGAGEGFMHKYGEMWRTGANTGTRVSFSTDVTVEGKALPKGEYLLLTIPGQSEWTVILYKDLSMGGYLDRFDAKNEAIRFTVKSEKLTRTIDTFTVNITDLTADSKGAKIELAWETTSVKFGFRVP